MRDTDDIAAWHEFEGRYGDLILRYCYARRVQHADAEDVRQLVMIGLASALRSFKYDPVRGRFRSYLGRAVRNAVIRVGKCPAGQSISLEQIGADIVAGPDDFEDDTWTRLWQDHHLRRAFRTLRGSLRQQSVDVFERLMAGDSTSDVADQFELTNEAVSKIKQRVRSRLAEIVQGQINEEDGPDSQNNGNDLDQ